MIIFSTAWYILKAKFNPNIYSKWIDNLLTSVNNFKLVIYTDKKSLDMIEKYKNNPNIKIILLELEEFYNYKYKDFWIKNHKINTGLNTLVDWKVNMLWNEKIAFVEKTYKNNYFSGDWYGWIDIGYFRNGSLLNWPNPLKIQELKKDKIYYARVNNNNEYINNLIKLILNKDNLGLPKNDIPANQISIAGGFFLINYNLINWYKNLHDTKLKLYIDNNKLVKDDQIIVIDNIVSNFNKFVIIKEDNQYDHWFLFKRYLL